MRFQIVILGFKGFKFVVQKGTNLTEAGQDKIYYGVQQFCSNNRHLAMQTSYGN